MTDTLPSRFQINDPIMVSGYRHLLHVEAIQFTEEKVYYQAGGVMHDSCDVFEPLTLVSA